MNKRQDKFNFFIPLELEKSKGADGKELVKIKGVASSNVKDSDGETLEPAGFDFKPLLESGFLNWNHQGQKTSKAICGEPTTAKIINQGKDFYIEGFLYPNEEGKYVSELADTLEKHSPSRRLGFSIEGVPMAVDPFNKKRITKARITGVAITQCPKNPNTLLSIMKGEYADAFQDPLEEEDEEEKKTKEKAMTTEAMAPATLESIEGGKKKLDQINTDREKGVGSYLKKSQIYGIILNRFDTDSESAKRIYSFIENLNENVLNMEKGQINNETIEKAFAILELAKGKKQEKVKSDDMDVDVDDNDADALNKSETNAAGKGSSEGKEGFDKSEDEEEDDEEKKEAKKKKFEKAKTVADAFMKAGMSREDCVKNMEKSGYEVKESESAYDSCVADANTNKDGGNLQGMTIVETGIVKSLITRALGGMTKQLNAIQKSNDEKFNALGTLLQYRNEENQILKSNISDALTTIRELNGKIENMGSRSQSRKSLQQAVPRFDNSEGTIQKSGESVPVGCEAYNIQNKEDLRKLARSLGSKIEIMKSNGGESNLSRRLEDTILEIEAGNFVDPQMYPTLRNLNIILQSPGA